MKIVFWATLSLLAVSCKQLERLEEFRDYPVTPVSAENYKQLSGTYSNKSDTACGILYSSDFKFTEKFTDGILINSLMLKMPASVFYTDSTGKASDENNSVRIDFTSEHSAIVKIYYKEKLIATEIISGKFKKGYFYRKPKGYFIPFFPLFFAYKNEQVRLGKSGNNLVVDRYKNNWGMVFFLGGRLKIRSKSVYGSKKATD